MLYLFLESRLTQLTIPGTREHVVIDKLEEGKVYDFTVKAVTSIGAGPETTKSITMGPQPGLNFNNFIII